MYSRNKHVLISFVVVTLLSLLSCTAKLPANVPIIILSNTPSLNNPPTVINSPTSSILAPELTPSPTGMSFQIPDGRILFEAYNNKDGLKYPAIKIHNIETGETTQIIETVQEVNGQQVHLIQPSMTWSPDGHWVAFVGHDIRADAWTYGYQDIFVVKADGTEIRRLIFSPQYDKHDLVWSPDGQHILVAMGRNGNSDLYLISAIDGEIVKRFTSSGRVFTSAWSPDGKRIAFGEYSSLFALNRDDISRQLLSDLPDETRIDGISWSPTGDKIAFSASEINSHCGDIYLFDLNTNEIMNVTSTNYGEDSPSWLPSGKYVAFSRASYACDEAADHWNVYVANLMGDEQQLVSNIGFLASVAWAPVPSLEIGKQYTVTELGANLNLRTEPSLNVKIIGKLPAGEVITVLDGFVDADDYYW